MIKQKFPICSILKKLVSKTTRLLQCHQLIYNFVKRHHFAFRFCAYIIAIADIDRTGIKFLLTNNYRQDTRLVSVAMKITMQIRTQDEVVLRNFSIPDLLWQCVLTVIYIGEQSKGIEAVSNFRCVVFLLIHGKQRSA